MRCGKEERGVRGGDAFIRLVECNAVGKLMPQAIASTLESESERATHLGAAWGTRAHFFHTRP